MAEETSEKQVEPTTKEETSQEETKVTIDSSEQAVSQEPGKEQEESSVKTEVDAETKARRKAKSDFDKDTALLDKFIKSPIVEKSLESISNRYETMMNEALTNQSARQTQTPTTQTPTSDDGDEVMTKADARKLREDLQVAISGAIAEPQKRSAMAEIGSFLDESIKAGVITEKERKEVGAIISVFDPDANVRLNWDEVASIAKKFLSGQAALNILSKMKASDIATSEKKQAAMKEIAQPDAASTPQPGKEKDSPEDKTLSEFREFHKNKSIFAKQ